jgi:hypothetical protein
MDSEKVKNEKASRLYAENPSGRDEYDEVMEGTLSLRVTHPNVNSLNEMTAEPELKKFHFRLNKNAIYYSSENKSYRGILGSLNLLDVVAEEDKTESNNCCSRIKEIKPMNQQDTAAAATDKPNSRDLYCFEVNSDSEFWKLCDSDKEGLNRWRNRMIE